MKKNHIFPTVNETKVYYANLVYVWTLYLQQI